MIKKFNDFVNESINDKLKLKVLFLCGLPNSGKSTVIKKLSYIPFHNIDMDKFLKLFADKEGVDLDLRYDAPDLSKKTNLRIISRDLATDKMLSAINSLLAIVVDGTGRDPMLMINQMKTYEKWGYDTAMLYVDIDLKTALKRNEVRDRKVPEKVIRDAHEKLVENINFYRKAFKNFWTYNTTTDKTGEEFKKIESSVRNFFYSPVKNPKGKRILAELKDKKLKYLSDIDKRAKNLEFEDEYAKEIMQEFESINNSNNIDFLYHGTSYENAINMMENGFSEDTYWGDENTAKGYAYSYSDSVLIKIPYNELQYDIEPNRILLEYYVDNIEEVDDYSEIIENWENSEKTPLDSLNIVGSVILPPTTINFTLSDIIKL